MLGCWTTSFYKPVGANCLWYSMTGCSGQILRPRRSVFLWGTGFPLHATQSVFAFSLFLSTGVPSSLFPLAVWAGCVARFHVGSFERG